MAALQLPEDLLRRLEKIASKREVSPEAMLDQLLRPYEPAPSVDPQKEADEVRQVMLRIYARARRYWHEDRHDRANMTDAELDEQFWLIDYEGIPRLKSEQGTIELPPDPLMILLEEGEEANFDMPSDISERSREILNTEFTDYIWNRMQSDDVENLIYWVKVHFINAHQGGWRSLPQTIEKYACTIRFLDVDDLRQWSFVLTVENYNFDTGEIHAHAKFIAKTLPKNYATPKRRIELYEGPKFVGHGVIHSISI